MQSIKLYLTGKQHMVKLIKFRHQRMEIIGQHYTDRQKVQEIE